MQVKIFEILDRMTCIPMMAVKLGRANGDHAISRERIRKLLARAGYSSSIDGQANFVLLVEISGGGGEVNCDPYDWNDRTKSTAHAHIIEQWDKLSTGDVIDVEFVLGETTKPKGSDL